MTPAFEDRRDFASGSTVASADEPIAALDTSCKHGWTAVPPSIIKDLDQVTLSAATDVTLPLDTFTSTSTSTSDSFSDVSVGSNDDSFQGEPLRRKESIARKPPRAHPALTGSVTVPPHLLSAGARNVLRGGRVSNFSPGPTSLPRQVEAEVASRFASPAALTTLALSHRTPEFRSVLDSARDSLRRVMKIPEAYEVLFLHGGGHGQFASVPLNLCPNGTEDIATYIVSGHWSERCLSDAEKYCSPRVISAKDADTGKYETFPDLSDGLGPASAIDPKSKYIYLCSNETVGGVEVFDLPVLPPHLSHIPLVVDASSDFTSKPVDWIGSNVGVLFACASKNIGHPGVTAVVVRRDLLGNTNPFCPSVFDYTLNADAGNLYNTAATFNVEVVGLVMDWIEAQGGVEEMERRGVAKSGLIFHAIESSDGFYEMPLVPSKNRSRMNVPFRIVGGPSVSEGRQRELTEEFLIRCWEEGLVGLRTMTPFGFGTHLRASLYHGVDLDDARRLASFMVHFSRENR